MNASRQTLSFGFDLFANNWFPGGNIPGPIDLTAPVQFGVVDLLTGSSDPFTDPVPEPAAWWLIAPVLAGLARLRRRAVR